MNEVKYILNHTQLQSKNIEATLKLLSEGATIPFISRYRKEATGGLDEVEIANIRDASLQYNKITDRQTTIKKAIEEQEALTDELRNKINACFDLNELEDLYLPYKKKRKTRAEAARQLGLEGLAKLIMSQGGQTPEDAAKRFVKDKVNDAEAALAGARDIIAEWINENSAVRSRLRKSYSNYSQLTSKVVKTKKEEAEKYRDYFDYSSSLKKCPSYRFLAIYRANKEGLLRMKVVVDEDHIFDFLHRYYVKGNSPMNEQIELAYEDAYKRLLHPALENEALSEKKTEADISAIKVFSDNLRQLLLAPPLGKRRILAIDPGFRTGCKVVCIDEAGELLTNATIFPHAPQRETDKAKSKIWQLVEAHKIDAIAIGNGTASRETEFMVKRIKFKTDIDIFVVSEDGASVYSASSIARQEFPDYDVTVRGAVSIGRRLMDPLAELVKIDPKSIGVGQYQHEVDQKLLKESLDDVVISAVNEVGVNLNTASPYLLSYVSGLGPQLAENIVEFRRENNGFSSRKQLKKVKRLGEKAFEQCAGFLRITDGKIPLDNSAVHPESYAAIEKMAKQLNMTVEDLIGNAEVLDSLKQSDFSYIDAFTFEDIIKELKKPGRDPRKKVKVLEFDSTVNTIDDLSVGKKLNGIVTNVTNFGAFVNIGIKENGLIHKSNLANTYVENPADYIKLHEHVTVEVIQLDVARKRIGLKRVE
ncbi:RNA-binding transcriptional accessory protein [Brumimicrobium salinarum]|uniref:RNA-binding transcriptional accessory protein n=1 Tax=Brumimicrobium salinarum TaxID=2058658 RepID=A0A2I0R2Z9_9FLAO|nr:Tex family protein [Brumimicrobium salinarum]PKR80947.1 RNA-binding transcriptional accessory protein [Brumimicrobium salinarum]